MTDTMPRDEPGWVRQLADDGYCLSPGVLTDDELQPLRAEFDRLYEANPAGVDQGILLTSPLCLDLLHHPGVQSAATEVFGAQRQLLMYALRRGDQPNGGPARKWHRDFDFITDRLISLNMILYLDTLTADDGATAVIPRSHRERDLATATGLPHPHEVTVPVQAGDMLLNWSTLVHSGTPKTSGGNRRLILLYFGYWWLKRYEHDHPLPWQALVDAPEERLALLGARMPGRDLHVDPAIAGHPCL